MITTKRKIGKWLGKGLECVVYGYESDKVIKIYYYLDSAKHAIHYGRIAFENGIGPEVFSNKPFEYPVKYQAWKYKHAIICECVRTAEIKDFDDFDDDSEEPIDVRHAVLCEKCIDLFGDCYDLHIDNLGWSKDGQLIMIDFGPESIS